MLWLTRHYKYLRGVKYLRTPPVRRGLAHFLSPAMTHMPKPDDPDPVIDLPTTPPEPDVDPDDAIHETLPPEAAHAQFVRWFREVAPYVHAFRGKTFVVAFAGDGCFLMNGQEFATAVQYDAPVIVVVLDNAQYGTIRMHQERDYPGRVVGTQLKNPDFAAMAVAFGGHGETVRKTEEFAPAFERALASGKPAILHCFLDRRAQSVGKDFNEQQ